jgi:hypothetical protein
VNQIVASKGFEVTKPGTTLFGVTLYEGTTTHFYAVKLVYDATAKVKVTIGAVGASDYIEPVGLFSIKVGVADAIANAVLGALRLKAANLGLTKQPPGAAPAAAATTPGVTLASLGFSAGSKVLPKGQPYNKDKAVPAVSGGGTKAQAFVAVYDATPTKTKPTVWMHYALGDWTKLDTLGFGDGMELDEDSFDALTDKAALVIHLPLVVSYDFKATLQSAIAALPALDAQQIAALTGQAVAPTADFAAIGSGSILTTLAQVESLPVGSVIAYATGPVGSVITYSTQIESNAKTVLYAQTTPNKWQVLQLDGAITDVSTSAANMLDDIKPWGIVVIRVGDVVDLGAFFAALPAAAGKKGTNTIVSFPLGA